jgi:hypothetical protein
MNNNNIPDGCIVLFAGEICGIDKSFTQSTLVIQEKLFNEIVSKKLKIKRKGYLEQRLNEITMEINKFTPDNIYEDKFTDLVSKYFAFKKVLKKEILFSKKCQCYECFKDNGVICICKTIKVTYKSKILKVHMLMKKRKTDDNEHGESNGVDEDNEPPKPSHPKKKKRENKEDFQSQPEMKSPSQKADEERARNKICNVNNCYHYWCDKTYETAKQQLNSTDDKQTIINLRSWRINHYPICNKCSSNWCDGTQDVANQEFKTFKKYSNNKINDEMKNWKGVHFPKPDGKLKKSKK